MTVNAQVFAAAGAAYLDTGYSVLDCQGLVEQMLADAGIVKDWRGSNHMYRDMRLVMTVKECVDAFGTVPVGALLFILKRDGGEKIRGYTDGLGNASHVGVRTAGSPGAIHSSSSRGKVAWSEFDDREINGGWNRVGFMREVWYGETAEKILTHLTGESVQPPREESSDIRAVTCEVATGGGWLNVREKPRGDAKVIATVNEGEWVSVVEDHGGSYVKISLGNREGWVLKKYLRKKVALILDEETALAVKRAIEEAME